MRILILHSRYRSGQVSGENRVVEDEARLLSDEGHQVDMFVPMAGDVTGAQLLKAGFRVIWSRHAAEEVHKRVKRMRPDVIHCHNLFPNLSPSVLRTVTEAPVVMTLHNYRLHCLPGTLLRDGKICEDCLGRTPWPGVVHGCYQGSVPASVALASSLVLHRSVGSFQRIDLYLAISKFIRKKHIEGGLPPDRVIVKPNFVWPGRQREGPGDYFLYVGRLAPEKGVATLVEAWRGIKARLLIVGDGPDLPTLRSIASGRVEFLGSVSADQVGQLLTGARALVVPSIWYEGAGRVVLEAFAAGVPVIAAQVGALPEAVSDGVTGILVPPGDVGALVESVVRLLDDSEAERMGGAAYRLWSSRYTPEHGLAALVKAYREALAQQSLTRST